MYVEFILQFLRVDHCISYNIVCQFSQSIIYLRRPLHIFICDHHIIISCLPEVLFLNDFSLRPENTTFRVRRAVNNFTFARVECHVI